MQPQEPAVQSPGATPVPQGPFAALNARLDDVMDAAEIGANSQRDQEAEDTTPQPTRTARQEAQPTEDPDDTEDADDDDEAQPAAQTAPAAESETPAEPVKYSRRDAARFAAEIEQHKKDVAEARQIATRAQAEINASKAADAHIVRQLADVSGYTQEQNGRFRIDNLKDKVLKGQATDQERLEVAEMVQWAELAGPIYRTAEQQVTRAFSTDWNALKDLEGIGDAGLQKLSQAPNGIAGAREMHALAFKAGQAKAKAEADQQIAKLRAENKSLKTRAVTGAPQPAVLNGQAVATGGGWRDRAFDPKTGLTTDEFDREVRAGKWLGIDLSQQ